MQDIITAVPSWILRWGITIFFFILVLIVSISALVSYPDIVKATMKISSVNSPKPIVSKIQGKLVRLLVKQNDNVKAGQSLAYLESTADHEQVITLLSDLEAIQKRSQTDDKVAIALLDKIKFAQLGELQNAYQSFYQEYLSFKSATSDGFFIKKRFYLNKDLQDLLKQQKQLKDQKAIQDRDFTLSEQQFNIYQKLFQQKVATQAELRAEESKYLAKKSQLNQTESALVSANTNYIAKQKEILELDNQVEQEKLKFNQALSSIISQAEDWKSKYVLTASQAGKLELASVLQENDILIPNQEVFYIDPGNEDYFGEMNIPQASMGKVKEGQQVLIKLRSYPFEEFGMLKGQIVNISDVPFRDSVFLSKVDFKLTKTPDIRGSIHLKQGMIADAEIVTQEATIMLIVETRRMHSVGPK